MGTDLTKPRSVAPKAHVERMLGATDLAARSVLVLILADPHCFKVNCYDSSSRPLRGQ